MRLEEQGNDISRRATLPPCVLKNKAMLVATMRLEEQGNDISRGGLASKTD